MTIENVFKKCDKVTIDYLSVFQCRKCKKIIEVVDEEYSFMGDIEEFKEKYYNPQNYEGVLEFETEVEQTEGSTFTYKEWYESKLCEECENKL